VTGIGSQFEYQYLESTSTFYKVPTTGTKGIPGATTTVPQDYFYQPNCPSNAPVGANGVVDDSLCTGALIECPRGQIRTRVYQRATGSGDVPVEAGLICVGPERTITLTDLTNLIGDNIQREFDKTAVGVPPLIVSPPTLALVNLPVIASTTTSLETLHITDPLTADVQLVPVPTWDFGDGSAKVTGPVGLAYDGTNAINDPGHYPLTHTYAKPGSYTITLSVLWTAASVTTARHPDPIPLAAPRPTVTTTNRLLVNAHEAHAVLVSGG
jgi:hypothetical protein